MQVEFPNAKPLTPEDEEHLARLRILIDKAVEDGVLTSGEIALIRDAVAANKKFLPEELMMVKTLVREKISCGEIEVTLFDRLY